MNATHRVRHAFGLLGLAIAGGVLGIVLGFFVGLKLPSDMLGDSGDSVSEALGGVVVGMWIGFVVGAIGLPLAVSLLSRRRHAQQLKCPKGVGDVGCTHT